MLNQKPQKGGISKYEIKKIDNELAKNLNRREREEVRERLELAADPDTLKDMRYGRKRVSAEEAAMIKGQFSNDKRYSKQDREKIGKVIDKYVKEERRPGLFG